MALECDWREIENWDDLNWDTTQAIAFATMLIGMGSITEKNYREFYTRMKMYSNATSGTWDDLTLDTINVENHAKQIIEAVGGAYLMQIMTEEEVYEAAANRMPYGFDAFLSACDKYLREVQNKDLDKLLVRIEREINDRKRGE